MSTSVTLERRRAAARSENVARTGVAPITDDKAMLRTAADLTRDLNAPRPSIYWGDLLASAAIGYAALTVAVMVGSVGWAIVAGAVAILALYRALSFIPELTHIKHAAMPGFWLGWNLLAGIPLLVPSFMYEGVHNLHHARTRYGTIEDPEYLPLALMKPYTLPLVILISLLAPIGLLVRFAVLTPLALIAPKLRTLVDAQYSGLTINPSFRRRPPEGAFKTEWRRLEAATSLWAIFLLAITATGVMSLRTFLILVAVAAGVAALNTVRTRVAQLSENE